jgi:transposase InsO family protein
MRLINELTPVVPVSFSCRYFGIPRSTFYYWKKGKKLANLETKKSIQDAIKRSFKDSKGTYGAPRVHKDLQEQEITVSENTVAKYMKELGLDARLKKKFRVQTTDSNHDGPIAERLFKSDENDHLPEGPGKVIAGDITYLRLGNSFMYLAVVLDLFNREVIGWSISDSLSTKVVTDALSMAMSKVGPDAEVIFHSDRGSQYASEAFRKLLRSHKALPSMSRKGNCYDNAYVESWFGSFKKEWLYRSSYSTESELRQIVFEYIEVWYNRKRRHSALDYKSPSEYKLTYQTA